MYKCMPSKVNIVKLVNRSCAIVERNHLFNLWTLENDLSTDALIAGFSNISLHTEITLNHNLLVK